MSITTATEQITPYLIQRAQAGEQAAKMQILESLKGMVKKLSKHWDSSYRDDALQTGYEGILIAIDRYDVVKHPIDFAFYSYTYIHRALVAEYARIYGLTVEDLIEYQKAQYQDPKPVTLPNGIRVKDIDALLNITSNGIDNKQARIDDIDVKIQLDTMIERLPERMQDILTKLREGYTQAQIATELNLSKDQVNRLYQRACKLINSIN